MEELMLAQEKGCKSNEKSNRSHWICLLIEQERIREPLII